MSVNLFGRFAVMVFACLLCTSLPPPCGSAFTGGDDSLGSPPVAEVSDVCLDYGTPTVLQCACEPSEYDIQNVHCTVADHIAPDDRLWSSFRSSSVRLESFTLKARQAEFLVALPLEVARHSPHLKDFTVQRSGVTSVPSHAFRNGSIVQQIDLDANAITELHAFAIAFLPNLEVLSLNENQLGAIRKGALVGLPQLRELYLVSNHIERLEDHAFVGTPGLVSLDLARNRLGPRLRPAVFAGLSRLQQLDLGGNQLRHLAHGNFLPLIGLHVLILRGNRLVSIEAGAFDGLNGLLKLHLSKNELLSLHDHTLRPLRRLVYLDLSNNNMTTLTEATMAPLNLRHNNLTYVSLAGNNFTCDCRLRWMLDMVKLRSNFHLNSWTMVTCTPPTEKGENATSDVDLPTDDGMVQADGAQSSAGGADRMLLTDAVKYVDVEQCPSHLYASQPDSDGDAPPTLRLSGTSGSAALPRGHPLTAVAMTLVAITLVWLRVERLA